MNDQGDQHGQHDQEHAGDPSDIRIRLSLDVGEMARRLRLGFVGTLDQFEAKILDVLDARLRALGLSPDDDEGEEWKRAGEDE